MEDWTTIFLISFGAILGSNLRVFLVNHFTLILIKKYWITFIINLISSFLLGLLLASLSNIHSDILSYRIYTFCSIGFLGGLSTFSTFILDLFVFIKSSQYYSFIKLLFFYVFFGLLATYAGYLMGN